MVNMCGIVGVVVKQSNGFMKKQQDVFYQMLFADTLRGDDSTGIIAVENTGGFHIAKEATEATWVIDQLKKHALDTAMYQRGAALIGHNRKATVGKITDETAHPFVIDGVYAQVHNGTLYNHKQLANTEVDSEALAKVFKEALEKENYHEAMEETLGKVWGAYATISYDQKTNKVYAIRNKERPLCYVETDDGWFFASEGVMLVWIASRNGYDMSKIKVQSLEEDTLMSINLEDNEVLMEKLFPKKATPSTKARRATQVAATGGATHSKQTSENNSTFQEGGVLSKNEFKRLRKKYMYTKQEFWALDYVEKYFPRTLEQGETELIVFGESDDLNYECTITAHTDLKDIEVAPENMGFLTSEHKWTGFVNELTYDRKTGTIVFHLIKARPVTSSKEHGEKREETKTAVHTLH